MLHPSGHRGAVVPPEVHFAGCGASSCATREDRLRIMLRSLSLQPFGALPVHKLAWPRISITLFLKVTSPCRHTGRAAHAP